MKTLLVTGGAGFIGSNFVHYCYRTHPDWRILVLDALTYAGNVANLPQEAVAAGGIEFWYGNVVNDSLVENLVSRSDAVVHFAAESHVTRSIFDNRQFVETDVIGTQVVANAVLKHRDRVERFVHISSSEVYGTALAPAMDEEHPLNPMSPYAASKCGADRLVYSYWTTYQIPAVIVRPFNNFGPRQHLEKVVPRFITSCLLGEALTVHGDGTAARDFVYVDDLCQALDLLIQAPASAVCGEVYNVGTGRHVSILEIAHMVREAMQCDVPVRLIGNRPGQVFRHTCDARKVHDAVGWTMRTGFEQGLRQTIEWYRDNRGWWEPQMWLRHIPITTADGRREMH